LKKIISYAVIFFLFTSFNLIDVSNGTEKITQNIFNLKSCENDYFSYTFIDDNLFFDVKIREKNGNWENENISAYIESVLEFNVRIITNRGYPILVAGLKLPVTDNGTMFDYIENSEQCSKKTFESILTDEDISFLWTLVLFPVDITCTFEARIKNIGVGVVSGFGLGFVDNETIHIVNDSINVSGKPSPIPKKPNAPNGQKYGFINVNYTYNASTIDPYNDSLYYRFNWGDGIISDWIGPFPSGKIVHTNHSWNKKGKYNVRVQAKNNNEYISSWSDSLLVDISKKVEIKKPIAGLYLGNSKIINLPVVLIIGKIDVDVETPGIDQVEFVEFFINDELKNTISNEPYSWLWSDIMGGKYMIKVVAYDNYGNFAIDSKEVWKFL
jgi:hypothetical protein